MVFFPQFTYAFRHSFGIVALSARAYAISVSLRSLYGNERPLYLIVFQYAFFYRDEYRNGLVIDWNVTSEDCFFHKSERKGILKLLDSIASTIPFVHVKNNFFSIPHNVSRNAFDSADFPPSWNCAIYTFFRRIGIPSCKGKIDVLALRETFKDCASMEGESHLASIYRDWGIVLIERVGGFESRYG